VNNEETEDPVIDPRVIEVYGRKQVEHDLKFALAFAAQKREERAAAVQTSRGDEVFGVEGLADLFAGAHSYADENTSAP
jgi:hypothetical protein